MKLVPNEANTGELRHSTRVEREKKIYIYIGNIHRPPQKNGIDPQRINLGAHRPKNRDSSGHRVVVVLATYHREH